MDVTKVLARISTAPGEEAAFDRWLQMEDAVRFLKENAQQDDFVVYAGIRSTFIHAIVIPESSIDPPNIDDLMSWNFNASSSWSIVFGFSGCPAVSIVPPLDHTGSTTLNKGEQLVFARHFEGRIGDNNYFEFLQKIVHIFGLHYLAERNAYCRIDSHGDIEDVVRIVTSRADGDDFEGTVVTVNRSILDEYLVLANSAIVRTFDFTRFRPSHFGGWSDRQNVQFTREGDLAYRSHIETGHASYRRGIQIVRPSQPKEQIIKRICGTPGEEKRYSSFIAYDWKNKVIREISCAPGETANYFTTSELPFELSPAFFRPEVLLRYKADSQKYRLEERSVYCRGTWHLQTYDVNEAGQVHTYLVYLRDLPYEEQLYWRSYNERPKASISPRAMTTDFKGCWHLEYDPLETLKQVIRDLASKHVPWWRLRSRELLHQVHYPVTSSRDEWSGEIHQVDKLVVEGFETKWLRNKAQLLGRNPDPRFGSLRLVDECLVALGELPDDVQQITSPLKQVHDLRSKLRGHASGEDAVRIAQQILTTHGSYKQHFRVLCEGCEQALQKIAEHLRE